MISKKKYLLQAYYDWIADNQCTPYLLVNAEYPEVHVPTQYVRDGQIVLDISTVACRDLCITAEAVKFTARFSGQVWQICLPLAAILAIYAKENSQGMTFQAEDEVVRPQPVKKEESNSVKKPFLTVISNEAEKQSK
jgi:stringent starvation protein B